MGRERVELARPVLMFAAAAALWACGRTGPLVHPPDGYAFYVACSCGPCMSEPWCKMHVDGTAVPPNADGSCPPNSSAAYAEVVHDRFGHEGVTLYCDDGEWMPVGQLHFGSGEIDPCFLTEAAYDERQSWQVPGWTSAMRPSVCGAEPHACGTHGPGWSALLIGHTDGHDTPGRDDWLSALPCPKEAPVDPAIGCFPGADEATARAAALPVLCASCAMWGDAPYISSDLTWATAGGPRRVCAGFDEARTILPSLGRCSTTEPDGHGGWRTVPYDPGPTPYGHELVASPGSVVRVVSGGAVVAEAPVTGQASAWFRTGTFVLTNLQLKVPAIRVGGSSFSDGAIDLQSMWEGTLTTRGDVAVRRDTARLAFRFSLDGSPVVAAVLADADPAGRVTGSHFDLRASFRDSAGGRDFNLVLSLDDARPRPTVSLVSDSPLRPECRSPAGATVSAHAVPAYNGPRGSVVWTLVDGPNRRRLNGLTSSWDLPLRTPTDAPARLSVIVGSPPLEASDSALVEAVDTVAPAIGGVTISVPCGWGSSRPHAGPQLCQTYNFRVRDTCDPSPTILTTALDVFDEKNHRILSDQDPSCLTPLPGYLDNRVSLVTYQLYWSARDHWNNLARGWRTVFRVKAEPPTASCFAPRSVQILSSGPYP